MARTSTPARRPVPPDRRFRFLPSAFAFAYVTLGLVLSLVCSPLGDVGVEADFFSELAPAAQKLVAGDFAVTNYPFKGPVHSFLLAGVHGILGLLGVGWYRSGVVLSLLAAAATLLLLFDLVDKLAGRRAAWVMLVGVAATKVFFINAGKASSDLVFMLFAVAAVHHLLTRRPGAPTWLVTGALGGLAMLTRSIGAVVPVWAALIVVAGFAPAAADGRAWRRRLAGAGWVLLGAVVVVGPWLAISYHETGSPLATQNLQNVVAEFYGGARAAEIPPGGFASVGALIRHDPAHFAGHYLGNVGRHLAQDFRQTTAPATGVLALLGLGLLLWRRSGWRSGRGVIAFASFGLVYVLALGTVFYVPRFSLPLVPVYLLPAALLAGTLPRWRTAAAVAVAAVIVVTHAGYDRTTVLAYAAQQPTDLAGAIAFLETVPPPEHPGPATVMARKAHAAFYAGLAYVPYPGTIAGATDLLKKAAARGADYLVVGSIERRNLTAPSILDHLADYGGVSVAYADAATRIYRLDPAAAHFAVRADVAALRREWDAARAAGDADRMRATGLELARILSGDGELLAARGVLDAVHGTDAGRADPLVGLNLAWLCLQLGDTARGLAVLEDLGDRVPGLAGTPGEARALDLTGQLLARQGDPAAARPYLRRARDLYRRLGNGAAAEGMNHLLRQLGGD